MIRVLLNYIKILHLILLTIIVLFIIYFVRPGYDQEISVPPPIIKKTVETPAAEKTAGQRIPGIMEYVIIAEQNLFHPQRIIPSEKKGNSEPKPEIILFGTILSENSALAYIEDKKQAYTPTPGRGKRHRIVKPGDSIGEFIVKEIKPDSIELQKGEEKIRAFLYDKRKRSGNNPQSLTHEPARY